MDEKVENYPKNDQIWFKNIEVGSDDKKQKISGFYAKFHATLKNCFHSFKISKEYTAKRFNTWKVGNLWAQ